MMIPDRARQRERMVIEQIAGRGIATPAVLDAFRSVPRELFVPAKYGRCAYDDRPLPIEAGQTISQPYIVALMIDVARIGPTDRVLEVGAGSGYAAAVATRIAREVIAIERHPELARCAAERLDVLGYGNVRIVEGDGSIGWAPGAPYDAILVAAGGDHVPDSLLAQLAEGGRIVMPVGRRAVQQLVRLTRRADGSFERSELGGVRFVPLIGDEGWSAD